MHNRDRIALVGRNGSGKSTLLKMIVDRLAAQDKPKIAYVPQIIQDTSNLSGSEQLMNNITIAISQEPDILILDEPSNHLDLRN